MRYDFQKLIVMDAVVSQPSFSVPKMTQSVLLTPSLRIELGLIVVGVVIFQLPPIDDLMLQSYASETRPGYMLETPTRRDQQDLSTSYVEGAMATCFKTTLFQI